MVRGTGDVIDLRSDTVTTPSEAMRRAMATALVGDDDYGDDPTVRCLEEEAAELVGLPAGLFLPSGTMGNLVATMTHVRPGDELFAEETAHIMYYEQGGCARIAGAMPHPLPSDRGLISKKTLHEAIRPQDHHFPRPRMLAVENTHTHAGGEALLPAETKELVDEAHRHGLVAHLDGARLFNAAVACDATVREMAAGFDSVTFCVSKGLGAPVGSVLLGSRDFIAEARRNRKVVGGGMRQAGVIAAAGLVALEGWQEKIRRDHVNAERLAAGLSAIPGIAALPARRRTNMVLVEVPGKADAWVERLRSEGILVNAIGASVIRLVTHLDVKDGDIPQVVAAFERIGKTSAA